MITIRLIHSILLPIYHNQWRNDMNKERILELAEVLETVPKKKFDMDRYVHEDIL